VIDQFANTLAGFFDDGSSGALRTARQQRFDLVDTGRRPWFDGESRCVECSERVNFRKGYSSAVRACGCGASGFVLVDLCHQRANLLSLRVFRSVLEKRIESLKTFLILAQT